MFSVSRRSPAGSRALSSATQLVLYRISNLAPGSARASHSKRDMVEVSNREQVFLEGRNVTLAKADACPIHMGFHYVKARTQAVASD